MREKKNGLLSSGSWPQGSHNKIMTVIVDISSEFQILLLPNFVWWYSITCQTDLWRKCFAVVATKGQNFIECLGDTFWTIYLFVAKLSVVMHHYEPYCLAKGLFRYYQCQGQSEGSYNQNVIIPTISSKLLIFLQLNLVWWYSIISRSVLWKEWIVVFKFKGIVIVENFIQCLSVHIFSTTDVFAAELGVQMYYY